MFPIKIGEIVHSEYVVTSRYYDKRSYGTHGGIDLKVKTNTPIYSPCDGVITISEDKVLAGRMLSVKCGDYDVQFMHLSGYQKIQYDVTKNGEIIGYSGGEKDAYVESYTTGSHIHIQVKKVGKLVYIDEKNGEIITNNIDNKSITVYMTHYQLGDVKQNDNSPCTGASGIDLCKMRREGKYIIALTVDQRNKLGVKWHDIVRVTGKDFHFEAYVEDEMNKRFRVGCIKKQGYCIKADYAMLKGETFYSGVVTINIL